MTIDPRSLREIKEFGDCHLIPACLKVSDLTVRLDRDFDSKIGTYCDTELEKWVHLEVGSNLKGEIAVVGGSKRLKGEIDVKERTVRIPKPKRADPNVWWRQIVRIGEHGEIPVEAFVGYSVDLHGASLSMVNSAMLVLYHQGRDLSGEEFDQARGLLRRVVEEEVTASDFDSVKEMTEMVVAFDPKKTGNPLPKREEWRYCYDPQFEIGDGLLEDFPNKCIVEQNDALVVKLPYSGSLRGFVRFRK
jgi:hypothetical protein